MSALRVIAGLDTSAVARYHNFLDSHAPLFAGSRPVGDILLLLLISIGVTQQRIDEEKENGVELDISVWPIAVFFLILFVQQVAGYSPIGAGVPLYGVLISRYISCLKIIQLCPVNKKPSPQDIFRIILPGPTIRK